MGVKLGLSHLEKNIYLGASMTKFWGEYLDPRDRGRNKKMEKSAWWWTW